MFFYAKVATITDWQLMYFLFTPFMVFVLALRSKLFGLSVLLWESDDCIKLRTDDRRYCNLDIIIISILSMICIICFLTTVIVHIQHSMIYDNSNLIFTLKFNVTNPYFNMWILMYLSIVWLFFYVIKGVKEGIRKKLSKKFLWWLPLFIINLALFCPFYYVNLNMIYWTIFDMFGVVFYILFLNHILTKNE
ncbi:MAG: hypothetical protein GY756_20765 [bacterium]|nr:hypothetical protein [bacterium]